MKNEGTRPGRTRPYDLDASARMARQRSRDTGTEMLVRRELWSLGLRYRIHKRVLTGLRREADIVFTGVRVAVMIDGCYWHGCPQHGTWPKTNAQFWRSKIEGNQRRDRDTDAALAAAGWMPIRVWEHENPNEAAKRVAAAVLARRSGNPVLSAPSPTLGS